MRRGRDRLSYSKRALLRIPFNGFFLSSSADAEPLTHSLMNKAHPVLCVTSAHLSGVSGDGWGASGAKVRCSLVWELKVGPILWPRLDVVPEAPTPTWQECAGGVIGGSEYPGDFCPAVSSSGFAQTVPCSVRMG